MSRAARTARYPLLTTYYALLTNHYPLLSTHYLPLAVSTTSFLRLTTYDSLLTTHCSLLTPSLLTTHYSLLTTHYSPLTTRYSPLTTRYSLLTTHHSLPTTRSIPRPSSPRPSRTSTPTCGYAHRSSPARWTRKTAARVPSSRGCAGAAMAMMNKHPSPRYTPNRAAPPYHDTPLAAPPYHDTPLTICTLVTIHATSPPLPPTIQARACGGRRWRLPCGARYAARAWAGHRAGGRRALHRSQGRPAPRAGAVSE